MFANLVFRLRVTLPHFEFPSTGNVTVSFVMSPAWERSSVEHINVWNIYTTYAIYEIYVIYTRAIYTILSQVALVLKIKDHGAATVIREPESWRQKTHIKRQTLRDFCGLFSRNTKINVNDWTGRPKRKPADFTMLRISLRR